MNRILMMAALANAVYEERKYVEEKPLIIPKGCQEYKFGGVSVIARTYANAEKKARKRGLI